MLFLLALACSTSTRAAPAADLAWVDTASAAAPLSLTAADGTGLALREMRVEAVVDGPLAFTELHLTFDNPEDRRIEGRFEITLPTGAAVSRFAMKIGEHWQEGEVVELQAARRAYEDFLHRRSDPALLEYDAGNEFRARVFPIEPRSSKEIIIAWSHDLDVGEPWSLPTGGLPELGLLDATVWSGGKAHHLRTEYAVPEGDLSLRVDAPARMAMRGAHTSVVRLQPELTVGADPLKDVTVLVDTSASRALAFESVLADLKAVVAAVKGDVRVVAWDQSIETVYTGPAKAFGTRELDVLRQRGAMGASDLKAAVGGIGSPDRLVVLTDGVLTAGALESGPLVEAVKAAKIGRVDAVVRGGARDEALLGAWVASGKRDGVVLDADALAAGELGRRLALGTAGDLEVSIPGAEWVWPQRVSGLQPGDSLTVYADLARSAALDLKLDGRSVGRLQEVTSDGPLLVRASAQAEIGALLEEKGRAASAEERDAIIAEIVEVSTRNRVLSPHTALLVLETEDDYARFGIPRDALTDILVVKEGRLDWMVRKAPVLFRDGEAGEVEAPEDDERVVETKEEEKAKKTVAANEAPAEPMRSSSAPEMDLARDAAPAPPPPPARQSAAPSPSPRPEPRMREASRSSRRHADVRDAFEEEADERMVTGAVAEDKPAQADPLAAWEGDFRQAKSLMLAGDLVAAETFALAWHERTPGDPLALIALGEIWEAMGRKDDAARAYGSLIDLFPSRADLRRLAGERLETLGDVGLPLASDTFRIAVSQRADHPSGHRLLAWALARQGEHAEALAVLRAAMEQSFDRFEAAHRILREDAAIIAAVWKAAEPTADVSGALKGLDVQPARRPELRFVLGWETDANDVDFHIYDAKGGHAYYSDRTLKSGGTLYADITTGYGPECFAIEDPEAFPYTLQAHYYSRGPMGFGMGTLHVIEHDGKGGLHLEARPFVVMTDGAFVPLGDVAKSAF
ncbi:MAG: hypothetical protein H6734_09085 [Alphaproteobacteria bacterium]|nr:hypothetical protein [Alphaproteobacteria bacterium]